ncbi:ATP-binding protein [Cribrihabitans pelagius]|uniref:ATP-binding protein n=1 Tax=Cribrihabitans pelagius TaxID=1765746 RepID=UPI003B5990ED
MGEHGIHISGHRPCLGDPPLRLCFCHQREGARAAGCTAGEACQLQEAPNAITSLPLLPLCAAAGVRKQASGRAQVLILHDDAAGAALAAQVLRPQHCDTANVAACRLAGVGHPDLLHALACGFDMILLQRAAEASQALQQRRETELAEDLGGMGRIALFSDKAELSALLTLDISPRVSAAPELLVAGSRRDTARASAAALLPVSKTHVPLADPAPYGAVSLTGPGCDLCARCSWMCPAEALWIEEDSGALNFDESLCFQCGICAGVCPQQVLRLQPGMDLSVNAVLPRRLRAPGTKPEPGAALKAVPESRRTGRA